MSFPEAAVTENSPRREPAAGNQSRALRDCLLLAGLVVVGAVLRFLFLGKKSFWFDEGVSVQIAGLDWYNFGRILWRREANMSLYYLCLRGWLQFGHSEFLVRSLSAVFGVLNVPAIYYLGRQLFDSRTGQMAALLLAVNGFHIAYSQEARSYSLFVLLSTLSALFFVESLANPSPRNLRLHVTASVLAMYAHLFAVLLIIAEWISTPIRSGSGQIQRNWRLIGGLVSPLLLFVVTTGTGPLAWIRRPGFDDLWAVLLALCGNGGWLLALSYLLTCALAALPGARESNHALQAYQWGKRFLLVWIAFPLLAMFLVSQFRPVFLTRYFIFLLPPLALLGALGLRRLSSPWRAAATLIFLLGLSLHAARTFYAQSLNLEHEDWRSATRYVLSQAHGGDALIFHTAMGRMPFEYYRWEQGGPSVLSPHTSDRITYRDFIAHPDPDVLASASQGYARTWIVLSHNQNKLADSPDPLTRRLTEVFGIYYSQVETRNFPGVDVYLYSGARHPSGQSP